MSSLLCGAVVKYGSGAGSGARAGGNPPQIPASKRLSLPAISRTPLGILHARATLGEAHHLVTHPIATAVDAEGHPRWVGARALVRALFARCQEMPQTGAYLLGFAQADPPLAGTGVGDERLGDLRSSIAAGTGCRFRSLFRRALRARLHETLRQRSFQTRVDALPHGIDALHLRRSDQRCRHPACAIPTIFSRREACGDQQA